MYNILFNLQEHQFCSNLIFDLRTKSKFYVKIGKFFVRIYRGKKELMQFYATVKIFLCILNLSVLGKWEKQVS